MSYWAKAEMARDRIALIPTTLSDRIPEDHSVRLFWELLGSYDWRIWEARYCGCHGQPAIHPRIVAGVLLCGLTLAQGIRPSRRLEWACGHAVDFRVHKRLDRLRPTNDIRWTESKPTSPGGDGAP